MLNTDRCIIIEFAGMLIANVYLPCLGSDNRLGVCSEILSDIDFCLTSVNPQLVVVADDYNVDFQANRTGYVRVIQDFLLKHKLVSACEIQPDSNFVSL
jgi:hypothetical protein